MYAIPSTSTSSPLDDVILLALVDTSCPASEDITYNWTCDNPAADTYGPHVVSGRGAWYSTSHAGNDCDGYLAGNSTPSVTVDCGLATQFTAYAEVDVDAVTPTFSATLSAEPSSGPEPLSGVSPVLRFDGSAAGDVTAIAIDCTDDGPDEISAVTITDPTNQLDYPLTDEGDYTCSYATDATYTMTSTATREGITSTGTTTVIVTDVPAVASFGISPSTQPTYTIEVDQGTNPSDVSLVISNVGSTGSTLNWADNASESEAWLSCIPNSGAVVVGSPDTVTCTITSAALDIGTYQATVTYTDTAASPNTPDYPPTFEIVVSDPGTANNINAVMTPSRTACVAPCAVFFDARDTTNSDWSTQLNYKGDRWREFVDLQYTWDFDDPTSGNWDNGASNHSRNVDTGPVAGHLYESAGTYNARVVVSDGTNSASVTSADIVVTAEDSHAGWAGANTHCVGNVLPVAGAGGCPAGASVHQSADFDTALATDCNIDSDAVRCLFNRGDTFTVSTGTNISNTGPSMVGAYGTGDRPIVNISGGVEIFSPRSGSEDFRVMDLFVQGTDGAQRLVGHSGVPVVKFLALRVALEDVHNHGYNFFAGGAFHPVTNMHNEIAVIDSTTDSNAGGSFDIFICAEKYLFMGNNFGRKGGEEHVFRSCYTHGAVISHNSMGWTCGESRFVIKLHNSEGDPSLGGGNPEPGHPCSREFIIADNHIVGCDINRMDVNLGPNGAKPWECVERFIVERNHFELNANTTYSWKGQLNMSGHGSVARHNLFDASDTDSFYGVRSILVRENVSGNYSPWDDNRIYNNTFYTADDHPASGVDRQGCQAILIESGADRTIVKNNVMWSPSENDNLWPLIRDQGSGTVFCDTGSGDGDCNLSYVNGDPTPFVSSAPDSPSSYTPHGSSSLIDAGDDITGATPFNFGNTTTSQGSGWDIGAWERMP
jgi:hypothetical protein